MSGSRTLLLAALPLALTVCKPKQTEEDTQPPTDAKPAAAGTDEKADTTIVATPVPAGEKIELTAAIKGVDDVFAAIKKISASYDPDSSSDPMADIQAQLLAFGFGPGFLGNVDLGGVHAMSTKFPVSGSGTPEDSTFAAAIAVKDGRKVLESTPSAYRPSPLGEGMWEFNQDQMRLMIKEAGKELHLGFSLEDLDEAGKLRATYAKGRRFRAKASNLPVDNFDPVELLDLPDSEMTRALGKVLQQLDSVELEADIGTKRDFQFVASANAPFSKLGLDPLGKPRDASTKLERKLPADPVFVMAMSFGEAKMLHKVIDENVPVGAVPPPFDEMVKSALKNTHKLLDELGNNLVFALYVDSKGRGTVLMAAGVKNDDKAKKSIRGINEVIKSALDTQRAAAGKNKDQAFVTTWEPEKAKLGKVKGDRFSVTIPKAFEEDFEMGKMFLDKNKLTTVTMVEDNVAIVAIGSGGTALMTDIAKSLGRERKTSLGDDAGLAGVRKGMGGCQVCVAGDPVQYFRFRLMLERAQTTDKKRAKELKAKMSALSKMSSIGDPGAGIRVGDDSAALGIIVPQSVLFAPRSTVERLMDINDFLDGADASAERVQ